MDMLICLRDKGLILKNFSLVTCFKASPILLILENCHLMKSLRLSKVSPSCMFSYDLQSWLARENYLPKIFKISSKILSSCYKENRNIIEKEIKPLQCLHTILMMEKYQILFEISGVETWNETTSRKYDVKMNPKVK